MRGHSHRDGSQRWASILAGAGIVAVVGWMTVEAQSAPPLNKKDAPAATSVSAASSSAVPRADAEAPPAAEIDGGLFLPTLTLGDAAVMPSNAPRSVKIGVVLVAFAGAEGAPPTARSKKDARTVADRLSADARTDFHQAVTGGDPGSADDIGRLPRGVLDPSTEVAVFALPPGEVSDVLETPRGYWIVKRIE